MSYDNLTNEVTSVESTWTVGGSISYTSLSLQSGIPHKDQLEVERIFGLPTSGTVTLPGAGGTQSGVNIKDTISTYDLHRIFIVNKNDYAVNESSKTITSLTPSSPTTRTYTFERGDLAGKTYTIPTISSTQVVVIRRKTVSNTSYVTWAAGSRLTSDQLNLQVQQLLKINQELVYKLESEYLRVNDISGTSAPSFNVSNDLNMQNKKIINLALAVDDNDGVSKVYAESNFVRLTAAQTIAGNKTFSSPMALSSTLAVTGNTTMSGSLAVTGVTTLSNSTVNGTLTVSGAAALQSTLGVTGNITANGALNVTGAITATGGVVGALTGNVTGNVTGSVTGNASTATTLQTSRNINGVAFNGSADITVAVAASALTGTALASNVVSSSLTSVGTLNNLTTSGTTTVPNVKISNTASADVNTLDYYEEGTWTPVMSGVTFSPAPTGKYTRIGNIVHVSFALNATSFTGTPTHTFTGLPFTANQTSSITVTHNGSNTFTTVAFIQAKVTAGSQSVTFVNSTAGGSGNGEVQTAINSTVATKVINFTLTYFV